MVRILFFLFFFVVQWMQWGISLLLFFSLAHLMGLARRRRGGPGGSNEEVDFLGYAMVGRLLSTTAKFKWDNGLAPPAGKRNEKGQGRTGGDGAVWRHFVMNFSSQG